MSSLAAAYNFPWPDPLTDKQVKTIDDVAQGMLDAHAQFRDSSLADLYDEPISMPPALVKTHHALDHVVDAPYGKKSFRSDAERMAFLFELYRKYTPLLPVNGAKKRPTGKRQQS